MRRFLSAVAALGMLAVAASSAAADTVLRIGTAVPQATPQGRALDMMAKLLSENGSGLELRIYHGGQLGAPDAQVQNVKIGAQDGFAEGLAMWETFSPSMGLASAPFVFDGREHLQRWLGSDYFDAVQKEIVEAGGQRLIVSDELWWRGPFRVMMATRPILTLEDVATMKMRASSNAIMTRYWGPKGLGANTINIAWNDTYLSLLQGVAESVTSPFDLVVSMRFVEVAKHVMLFDEYQTLVAIAMNEAKWQSLTDEQRKAFNDAMTEAGKAYNAEVDQSVEKWMQELRDAGATIHEFDRAPFVARVAELNRGYEKEGLIPAGLLDAVEALRQPAN